MPDDKRKFAEDTAKLIASLQTASEGKPAKRADQKAPVSRARRSESKARDTEAAMQMLKDHAARRVKR
jgi:hypothetical protein